MPLLKEFNHSLWAILYKHGTPNGVLDKPSEAIEPSKTA